MGWMGNPAGKTGQGKREERRRGKGGKAGGRRREGGSGRGPGRKGGTGKREQGREAGQGSGRNSGREDGTEGRERQGDRRRDREAGGSTGRRDRETGGTGRGGGGKEGRSRTGNRTETVGEENRAERKRRCKISTKRHKGAEAIAPRGRPYWQIMTGAGNTRRYKVDDAKAQKKGQTFSNNIYIYIL